MNPVLVSLALLAALVPVGAEAATRRIAVVVGHNAGASERPPLRYAEDDATKIGTVLTELGGVNADDLFVLRGRGVAALREVLDRAAAKVIEAHAVPDLRVVFVFYYSGHADGEAIELGAERFTFDELRERVAKSGADVRLAIVDSCKSGALIREKGGRPGPAFDVDLVDHLATSGEVMLTSSADDEVALESSEIRGSFFTHHLVSGLRGAADRSADGQVTLSEAYEYAFHRTVATTAASGAIPQHPEFDYRLTGQGELVLTRPFERNASIALPDGFTRALLVDVRRDRVVAEVTGDGGRRIAVGPGRYAVRLWKGAVAYAARVEVEDAQKLELEWERLAPVEPPDEPGAPKGPENASAPASPSKAALDAYAQSYIHFGKNLIVSGRRAYSEDSYQAYQGEYGKPLDGDELFRLVGREDLAEQFERRRAAQIILATLGGASVAFGVGYLVHGIVGPEEECVLGMGFASCLDQKGSDIKRTGLVFTVSLVAGVAVVVGAAMINPYVLEKHEVRALAGAYNDALKQKLGLEGVDDLPTEEAPDTNDPKWTLVPTIGTDGGGLAFALQF